MRFLLPLLAVLAMLAGPAIAAARAGCGGAMHSTSALDMPARAGDTAMPCCPDVKSKPAQPKKPDGKSCAQMCAAMSGVAVVIAPSSFAKDLLVARVVLTGSNRASARSFKPLGPDRPPKPIA